MKTRDDRERFVTALYATACKDREELLELVQALLARLKGGSWSVGRDKRLIVLIEDTLAGIEKRKAGGKS